MQNTSSPFSKPNTTLEVDNFLDLPQNLQLRSSAAHAKGRLPRIVPQRLQSVADRKAGLSTSASTARPLATHTKHGSTVKLSKSKYPVAGGGLPTSIPDHVPDTSSSTPRTVVAPGAIGHRVLVIYTGGTIGMKRTAQDGFAPAKNFLKPYLRQSPLFNDRDVVSPSHSEDLLTPLSRFGKHVPFSILEFDPLLDSSDMSPSNWITIAETIEQHYDAFDAFVVLHGTDTMSFTAAALSFMLESLNKTVVLTGSQVPLSIPQSDGIANLMGALTIAGHFHVPEVLLFFSDTLMRGNRTSKVSADDFDGFKSLNFAPIASVGTEIKIDWNKVLPMKTKGVMRVHKAMDSSIVVITLFPGIRFDMIEAALLPPCKGAILRTFGAGNGPTSDRFLGILKSASDRGVVILNITQCGRGNVSPHYATGITLAKAGVIAGSDMTFESAVTKLCYCLGKQAECKEPSGYCIKDELQRSMRGEVTTTHSNKFNHRASDTLSDMLFQIDFKALEGDDSSLDQHQRDQLEVAKTIGPVLMCSAAAADDVAQVRGLLNHGISPSMSDYDGRSGLHVAAAEGAGEVIAVLIDAGAQLSCADRFGRTPLEEAVRHRRGNTAKQLRKAGAEMSMTDSDLSSLLCHCGSTGDSVMLELLHSVGCDLNTADYDGRVALHLASSEGQIDAVRMLLRLGADKNRRDRWGGTAETDAQTAGHRGIAELLGK